MLQLLFLSYNLIDTKVIIKLLMFLMHVMKSNYLAVSRTIGAYSLFIWRCYFKHSLERERNWDKKRVERKTFVISPKVDPLAYINYMLAASNCYQKPAKDSVTCSQWWIIWNFTEQFHTKRFQIPTCQTIPFLADYSLINIFVVVFRLVFIFSAAQPCELVLVLRFSNSP